MDNEREFPCFRLDEKSQYIVDDCRISIQTARDLINTYVNWRAGKPIQHDQLHAFFEYNYTKVFFNWFEEDSFWGHYYNREFGNLYKAMKIRKIFDVTAEKSK